MLIFFGLLYIHNYISVYSFCILIVFAYITLPSIVELLFQGIASNKLRLNYKPLLIIVANIIHTNISITNRIAYNFA